MELISVILPVYNGEQYIAESLDSVLSQTYANIEVILIDDCSADQTASIVNAYQDERIKYFRNETNRGIVYSLNRALDLCSGEYIARMDADDICESERFNLQIQMLKDNPDIYLISTWFHSFGATDNVTRYAVDPDEIKCRLLFSLQLLHPGWMMKRELVDKHGMRYREEYKYAEDWDFLVRASRKIKLSNVPEILMHYRISPSQISQVFSPQQNKAANKVAYDQLVNLGVAFTNEEFAIYRVAFGAREVLLSQKEMHTLFDILEKIEEQNSKLLVYNAAVLRTVIAEELFWLSYYNLVRKNKSGRYFLRSKYLKWMHLDAARWIKLVGRLVLSVGSKNASEVRMKAAAKNLDF